MLIPLLKLTKPGILASNALTVPAGFFVATFAYNQPINWLLFLAVMLGSTLIIAAACVLNNYLDQDIDRVMGRTKNRPLVSGQIKPNVALIFSVILGLAGVAVLYLWVNMAVLLAGIIGFVTYVWLYGAWTKRQSVHGTLVGSISGAIPILSGYLAVSNQLDLGGILVFLVLFLWQQPEFYAISIYRKQEYQAANIPLISIVKGIPHTQKEIVGYIMAFALVNIALSVFGYAGWTYAIVMTIFCLLWIGFGLQKRGQLADDKWARAMFRYAMYAILIVCLLLPISPLLP